MKKTLNSDYSNFKIDFINVGFGRSGTRWLAYCLAEHSEVSISPFCITTEVNYFPEEYELMGLKNYIKKFEGCDFNKVVGEVSCTPIMHKRSAKLIKSIFPDIKIIICKRDELARAKSAQKTAKLIGLQKNPPLKMINQEEYIAPFKKVFKKNLFIFDMQSDRQKELNRLYKFLGVSEFTPPSLNRRVGEATAHKTRFTPIRKIVNYLQPRLRKNKKLYFFMKRNLHLDRGFQIFSSKI